MKTLYLECNMGAAGDMLLAALTELLPDKAAFVEKLNHLGIPGVTVSAGDAVSCGVHGLHMTVKVGGVEEESHDIHHHHHEHEHHDHEHEHHEHEHTHEHEHHEHHHHHSGMAEIRAVVGQMPVSDAVKQNVMAVYEEIAKAESRVHGTSVEQVHFHEVGAMDAVADITGVCMAIEQLAPDQIVASPVCTGFGQVRCAHGILPVPAPATALLLEGIPSYGGVIEGELCTPTGAALLRHFASGFAARPVMRAEKIGCGVGTKEFAAANILRAYWGETEDAADDIVELSCNLDDCTAEQLGFAQDILLENGALDVFWTAIGMKKGRPGTMLTCLSTLEDADRLTSLLFAHTTTLGVRKKVCTRSVLRRKTACVQTQYGEIRVKISEGYGVTRIKPEYDDCAAAAKKHGCSIKTVCDAAQESCGK